MWFLGASATKQLWSMSQSFQKVCCPLWYLQALSGLCCWVGVGWKVCLCCWQRRLGGESAWYEGNSLNKSVHAVATTMVFKRVSSKHKPDDRPQKNVKTCNF